MEALGVGLLLGISGKGAKRAFITGFLACFEGLDGLLVTEITLEFIPKF
jgi:hypothetical protein